MTPGRLTRTLPAAAALAALLAAGCGSKSESRSATRAAGRGDPTRMAPKDLQAFTAVNGVVAGAKAGTEAVAQAPAAAKAPQAPQAPVAPTTPPAPTAPVAVQAGRPPAGADVMVVAAKERAGELIPRDAPKGRPVIELTGVTSDKPHPSRDRALEDALLVAQVELMKELQKLDPPVLAKPSLATIRSEYLARDGVHEVHPSEAIKADWKAKGLEPNRVWVKIDVRLTEEQVQKLRAGERVGTGFQFGGVLFAALLAVYGFLRLDAWTKGYLTSWLAIGAVALVALALLAVVG